MRKIYRIKANTLPFTIFDNNGFMLFRSDELEFSEDQVEIIEKPETNREHIEAIFDRHDKQHSSSKEWRSEVIKDLDHMIEKMINESDIRGR